jgi:hypothetical protein
MYKHTSDASSGATWTNSSRGTNHRSTMFRRSGQNLSLLRQQSDVNLREVNGVTIDQHADFVAGMGAIELRDIDP